MNTNQAMDRPMKVSDAMKIVLGIMQKHLPEPTRYMTGSDLVHAVGPESDCSLSVGLKPFQSFPAGIARDAKTGKPLFGLRIDITVPIRDPWPEAKSRIDVAFRYARAAAEIEVAFGNFQLVEDCS